MGQAPKLGSRRASSHPAVQLGKAEPPRCSPAAESFQASQIFRPWMLFLGPRVRKQQHLHLAELPSVLPFLGAALPSVVACTKTSSPGPWDAQGPVRPVIPMAPALRGGMSVLLPVGVPPRDKIPPLRARSDAAALLGPFPQLSSHGEPHTAAARALLLPKSPISQFPSVCPPPAWRLRLLPCQPQSFGALGALLSSPSFPISSRRPGG